MLTLTPNRRLAAFLMRDYDAHQVAAGKQVWHTPQILHLKGWFNQIWQLCIENSTHQTNGQFYPILSDVQQQLLWEDIIRNSSVGVELLRIGPTAKNAIQAWKFLRQWQVSIDKLAAYSEFSVDTKAFYSWLQIYLKWLRQNCYTDFELMLDQMITCLPFFAAQLPQQITLSGVDELTPQQAAFFKQAADLGITITHSKMVMPGAKNELHSFVNPQQEYLAAAQWAANLINKDATATIAIVVPNLELQRATVQRIFSNYVAPEKTNISAPLGLINFGIVNHALLILQLCKDQISYEDFSIVLRSPYIAGGAVMANQRAQLDRILREKVEARITWQRLKMYCAEDDTDLFRILDQMQQILKLIDGTYKPSSWVHTFVKILEHWGWPGERGVTAVEIDLLACWQDLLHNFAKFDLLQQSYSYSQVLQLLQRIVTETPFLPAETGKTRLHILGVLEAAGISFDYLWVTGMDRDSWPPDAAPNPFIPGELQRQYDLPRSSPQRELNVARRLTLTLQQGAKHEVHFSYARVTAEHETAVSNLLAYIPEVNATLIQNQQQQFNLEQIIDDVAPAVQSDETIRGGASVLKNQAQCPFKAFAEIRMNAKKINRPQLLLDAVERGKIVHAILEEFWKRCGTQQQLLAWLPNMLDKFLQEVVASILTRWQHNFPITLTKNYIELEQQRLSSLMQRWLTYELQRAPFTVTQVEQKVKVNIGTLQLNVCVDRLDTLEDGSIVIIDYKTGNVEARDWFKENLIEPQMPLYAVSVRQKIAGVVYANVVPQKDNLKFTGALSQAGIMPDVKVYTEWDELLNDWQQKLLKSAADFTQGMAQVAPYDDLVCKRCNLQGLCRIYDC